jgi:hypothetical protein
MGDNSDVRKCFVLAACGNFDSSTAIDMAEWDFQVLMEVLLRITDGANKKVTRNWSIASTLPPPLPFAISQNCALAMDALGAAHHTPFGVHMMSSADRLGHVQVTLLMSDVAIMPWLFCRRCSALEELRRRKLLPSDDAKASTTFSMDPGMNGISTRKVLPLILSRTVTNFGCSPLGGIPMVFSNIHVILGVLGILGVLTVMGALDKVHVLGVLGVLGVLTVMGALGEQHVLSLLGVLGTMGVLGMMGVLNVLNEFGVLTVIGVLIVLGLQDVLELGDFLLICF